MELDPTRAAVRAADTREVKTTTNSRDLGPTGINGSCILSFSLVSAKLLPSTDSCVLHFRFSIFYQETTNSSSTSVAISSTDQKTPPRLRQSVEIPSLPVLRLLFFQAEGRGWLAERREGLEGHLVHLRR